MTTTPRIRIRATMTVATHNGALTNEAVAEAAMRSLAGMPTGIPLDLHIVGDADFIAPFAFHAISDFLIRASEITVHATGARVDRVAQAVLDAVSAEQHQRERPRTDPVLAAQYAAVARADLGGEENPR